MDLIFSAGFPLLFFIVTFLLSDKIMTARKTDKKDKRSCLKTLLMIFISEIAMFSGLCTVTGLFMFHDGSTLPPAAIIPTSALPYGAFLLRNFTDRKRTAAFLKRSAIALSAIFAAEVLLFNFKSFDKKPDSTYINLETVAASEGAALYEGDLLITGNTSLTFGRLPDYTRALIIEQEREDKENSTPFMTLIGIKDDNISADFETMRQKMITSKESKFAMNFTPYGELHETKLSFSDVNSPIKIHSIRAVSSIPFHFSLIRFFVISVIAVLIMLILSFRLWTVTYQPRKALHRMLVFGMVFFCTASTFLFMRPYQEAYEFDTKNVSITDPYAATADAFKKKQVYLDVEVDPALEAMKNPYNRSERDTQGIPYNWDSAYYKGHYYSYFGVVPVILYYYPYYTITGKMPTTAMAQPIFGAIAALAFCMTILAAIKLFVPRPNLLMLLCLMPVTMCLSGIIYAINYTNMYVLPTICGLCFLFLTLWTGLSACSCRKKWLRVVLLFISGASLALCTGSRPSFALSSVLLIPFFIGILRNKDMKLSFRLTQAAAFVIPMLIGGCALMWYNNARFGSPFDFGASYQLTVSDVHANKLHAAGFAPMLYHFVFLFPRPRGFFPFIEPNFSHLYNYGRAVYSSDAVGWLTYPLYIIGISLIPAGIQRRGRHFANSSTKRLRNISLLICFIMPFIIGWQSYCLGGINQRYIIDMTPLLLIGVIVCILKGTVSAAKNAHRYAVAHIGITVSFVIWGLMVVSDRGGNLLVRHPAVNDVCEELMMFWQ